jgi:hypothetical protein
MGAPFSGRHGDVHKKGYIEASIPLMISHSLVISYHGCDLGVARKIISREDDFKPSKNAWDWLGHGVYFWEDSHVRAGRWAQEECQRRGSQIKHPIVAAAVIDLGNCLNLADAQALKEIRAAHDVYVRVCAENGVSGAQNRGAELRARYLDCAVMETFHQLRQERHQPPFDTVRGFFMEGRPLYEGAGFRGLDHIQICVRSPKQIIGCFWPRP